MKISKEDRIKLLAEIKKSESITDKKISKNLQNLINSNDFFNFIMNEFNKTISYANIEELGEFAFGSFKDALINYLEEKK